MNCNKRIGLRTLLLLLSLLLLSALFISGVGAAESETETEVITDPTYIANNTLLQNYYKALLALKADNSASGTGRIINNYIDLYAQKLNNLDDAMLFQPDTANVIELYYRQGVASAQLAWIYYTHLDELSEDAVAGLNRVHTGSSTGWTGGKLSGLQGEIAAAKDAASLDQKLALSYANNGIYARMYVAVYEARILALTFPSDSDAVKHLADNAISQIKRITAVGEEPYEKIYAEAEAAILLQRYKDIATNDLKNIFLKIKPAEDINSHPTASTALITIASKQTDSLTKINTVLSKTVCTLLEEVAKGKEDFTVLYLQTLSATITAETLRCEGKQELAILDPLFKNYQLHLARAEAKDAVTVHLEKTSYASAPLMTALVKDHTEEDGILDRCDTLDAVALEQSRACLRIDLYGKYLDAEKKITEHDGDPALLQGALDAYEYADYRLEQVSAAAADAAADCKAEYEAGCRALEELIVDAEVAAYEPLHEAIVKKELSKLSEADREALTSAIGDLCRLSEGAQKVFEERGLPADLAAKYKKLAEEAVQRTLGDETLLRRDFARRLTDEIALLTTAGKASGLEELTAAADRAVQKADAADTLLTRYDAITASAAYGQMPEANKNALEITANNAAKAVCQTLPVAGEDFKTTLVKPIKEGLLLLEKEEAYALIDKEAARTEGLTEAEKAQIKALAFQAKEEIKALTDGETVQKRTHLAVFEICKERDLCKLEHRVDEILREIGNLDMLDSLLISAYQNQLMNYCNDNLPPLREMADEEVYRTSLATVSEYIEDYRKKVLSRNEGAREAKKDEARDSLTELHRETVDLIESMTFLDPRDRTSLKQAADLALTDGIAAIGAAHAPADIDAALADAIERLEWAEDEADKQNSEAGVEKKTETTKDLHTVAGQLRDELRGLPYLSDADKQAALDRIDLALEDFTNRLPHIIGAEVLGMELQAAVNGLESILRDCTAADLILAKEQAKEALSAADRAGREEMESYWFHTSADVSARQKETDALLAAAGGSIDACQNVDEVHFTRDDALKLLEEKQAAARTEEEIRCVDRLAPFMLVLGILCLVELCAAGVLWLLKRRSAGTAACFVPSLLLAAMAEPMMPVPLAWTLTVFLALADLALLVLIVYLAIKLLKYKKPVQVEFPEDAAEETETGVTPVGGDQKALPERKRARLGARPAFLRLGSPTTYPKITPGAQLIYLLPPALPETVSKITVEQADLMLTDEEAFSAQETSIVNAEVYSGKRKASLNIDQIAKHFEVGELVSINTLKEKGLIKQNVGHIKILGRGVLDKPLNVVAQNFSASAIKMILLTGGAAILAEGSPERR